jgi:uncharacterized protein
VFLKDLSSRWKEVQRIAGVEVAILGKTGAIVHTMPHPAGSWGNIGSPLMHEIRKDGVDL